MARTTESASVYLLTMIHFFCYYFQTQTENCRETHINTLKSSND